MNYDIVSRDRGYFLVNYKVNLKEHQQYCGHGPKSNLLAYYDKYNKIVTVEEKLNVHLMIFRKIVIDANL